MNETPDFNALTEMQQQTWSEGDFAMVANVVLYGAETLAESLRILPGEQVLDVACGSGNAAIAAARRRFFT
jgi:ubiquinone/menaquinone biosynthesis C-methylase UbiE